MLLGKLTALDMTPLDWLGRKTSTQTDRQTIHANIFIWLSGDVFKTYWVNGKDRKPRSNASFRITLITVYTIYLHLIPIYRVAVIPRKASACAQALSDSLCMDICISLLLQYLEFKGNGYPFRGGNSVQLFLFPFWKWSTIKGKNLLQTGANSFLLE